MLNYGFGIPDGVAKIVAERGHLDRYYQTIEHGTYGGELLGGHAVRLRAQRHGHDRRAVAVRLLLRRRPRHGLPRLRRDRRCRQRQRLASSAASRSAPAASSTSPRMPARWCSAARSTPRAPTLEIGSGRLTIKRHGEVGKFVAEVEQITYSGREALQARAGGRLRHRARRVPPDRQGRHAHRGGARHRPQERRAGRGCSSSRTFRVSRPSWPPPISKRKGRHSWRQHG